MAVEDTQAAAAAPEEGLSLDDSTEAAYGKAPDAAPCGEGADTEVGASAVDSAASDDAPDAASEADDVPEAQQVELTPEERELAENNALADVFDDVRRQSSDSQLVVPSRWVELGLVPGHMTSDEFEMRDPAALPRPRILTHARGGARWSEHKENAYIFEQYRMEGTLFDASKCTREGAYQ